MNPWRGGKGWWLGAIAAGFGVLLCFGAMQTLLPAFEDQEFAHPRGFGHPVIALEFASSAGDVEAILGSDGRQGERRQNLQAVQRVDVVFPLFYTAFLVLFAVALRQEAAASALQANAPRELGMLLPTLAVCAALLAMLADYGENALIERLLLAALPEVGLATVSESTFLLLGVAARLKFALLGAFAVLLAPRLRVRGWLGRFTALAGNATFVAMALGVVWPAFFVEPASALMALFWLAALGLAIRRVTHAAPSGGPAPA